MREMKMKDERFKNIHLYIWDDVAQPIGVMQIVHGLNEHGKRYDEFAQYLNKSGYIVYCHDHISQGKSRLPKEKTVYFGKYGVENLKYGVHIVRDKIKNDYPNIPIYAFGHSMGSAILRLLSLEGVALYDKIIINGTGLSSVKGLGMVVFLGKAIRLFGAKRPSKFFDNLFRQTQYKLREKVQMDHFIEWLTRDKQKTAINLTDKYLYIRVSVSGFINILEIIKVVNHPHFIKETDKKPQYFIMSGTHDPATNFGEDAQALYDKFNKLGIQSTLKLYPEGRHDTIQEINREEVFNDILEFINT